MPKPPMIDAAQFGAALDALCTTNATLFMLLASQEQSDAALRLLARVADQMGTDDGLNAIRTHVVQQTAVAIRDLQALNEAKGPAAGLGRN